MPASDVLCRLCDKSVPITGTRGVACFTRGIADDRVHLRYMYKSRRDDKCDLSIPLDDSSELSVLISKTIAEAKPIHHAATLRVGDYGEATGPCVLIPIIWRRQVADEADDPVERTIGVMLYWGIRSGVKMSDDDVRVAESLARQTSSLLVEERLAEVDDAAVALTTVPVALILLDSEDRIVLLNPMAEQVLDHTNGYDHHLSSIDRGEQLSSLVSSCRSGGLSSATFTTERGESLSATAQLAKDGECVVALSRVHLGNSAEQLVGQVSHELRTPLTSIQGYVQTAETLVEMGLQEGDREIVIEMLAGAASQCKRMTRLISETLNVSRIQAGREVEIRKVPIDLADVSREILAELSDTLSRHVMQVSIPEHCHMSADPDKLSSILDNLLRNAYKYSDPGTVIEFTVSGDADYVRVVVRDHGIGIPPEDVAKIGREPGFRTAPSQKQAGGIGLGMLYVRRVVEGHGGTLDIQSVLGEGSTFIVTMPRGEDDADGFILV